MAGLSEEIIQRSARDLYAAERQGQTLRPLTEKYPEIKADDAYRIQLALVGMMMDNERGDYPDGRRSCGHGASGQCRGVVG